MSNNKIMDKNQFESYTVCSVSFQNCAYNHYSGYHWPGGNIAKTNSLQS